jgi:hypothetical protein
LVKIGKRWAKRSTGIRLRNVCGILDGGKVGGKRNTLHLDGIAKRPEAATPARAGAYAPFEIRERPPARGLRKKYFSDVL